MNRRLESVSFQYLARTVACAAVDGNQPLRLRHIRHDFFHAAACWWNWKTATE
ncbi:MAG: hypothetical protein SGI92_13540 [Bryobacteraceae bacterium]|nr:hypothetical protein [Bryobacteraceae bacterium]